MSEVFDPQGALARVVKGFAPREAQLIMAEAVAETLAEDGRLVVEAGTGTGKTFAYLVPALLSGKKVIISTGTKNLQDQLFKQDLPTVRKALGRPLSAALLKGRANYLCLYRYQRLATDGRLSKPDMHKLALVRDWLTHNRSGDIADHEAIPEYDPIWPRITSTTENCLGGDCPQVGDCHVLEARRAAQEADILVVNHHLFFADLALRDDGFGEVLPGANAVIFDEAHQLSEVAAQFFGLSLTSRQLQEFVSDTVIELLEDAPEQTGLVGAAHKIEGLTAELAQLLGGVERRGAWVARRQDPRLDGPLTELQALIDELADGLEQVAACSSDMERCWRRAQDLRQRLAYFSVTAGNDPDTEDHQQAVLWYESRPKGFALHRTPISIAELFGTYVNKRRCAWVFTSATLAVGNGFKHFTEPLGLMDAKELQLESPFDFQQQALLYLPSGLPDPNSPQYMQRLLDAAIPVIEACGGRTFLLVTSYRALNESAQRLQAELDYPVLVQGSFPRGELLQRFKSLGNAVLIGTNSFWEGVDVRGEALSCVIIDRLPFSAPGDPVLEARLEAVRSAGRNPFMDYQLPRAVISLKQGVGRLIRDVDDRGLLMLCDPRLLTKSYGRVFLKSLPPMPQTRLLTDAEDFFASEQKVVVS